MVHFLTDKESIVRGDQVVHMGDFHMGVYQPMFIKITRKVTDISEEAKHYDFIPKVNVYFHSKEARQQAYEMLKDFPLSFAFAEGTSLEMTAQGVTKAAGLSVAMGNAERKIKEICDAITRDNNHNGVGEAIKRYVMSEC